MSRKIDWSPRAVREWAEILNYWIRRNRSNVFSLKLDQLFVEKFDIIAKSPDTGLQTDFPIVRLKIIRAYKIYYRVFPKQ
jgi:hypothetical protein